jgi:hypothetical protein
MAKKPVEAPVVEEQAAPAVEAPQAELTIVDLQNLRSIIDVASKRGAFGAGEMAAVGGVFNKLEAFLAVAAPAAPADQTAEQPAA